MCEGNLSKNNDANCLKISPYLCKQLNRITICSFSSSSESLNKNNEWDLERNIFLALLMTSFYNIHTFSILFPYTLLYLFQGDKYLKK